MSHRASKRLKTLSGRCTCRCFASSPRLRSLEKSPAPAQSSPPPPKDQWVPPRLSYAPGVDGVPSRSDGPPLRPKLTHKDYLARAPENMTRLMGQDELAYPRTKGKHFLAPETLIRVDRARYFPNITAKTPRKEVKHTADLLPGKVSLLAILNSRLSEQHLETYLSQTQIFARFAENPLFQHVQILHMANPAFRHIAWYFFREKLVHGHPVVQLFVADDVRRKQFYEVPEYAYLYIIDTHQRIRWAAIAEADVSAGEIKAMDQSLEILLQRAAANLDW